MRDCYPNLKNTNDPNDIFLRLILNLSKNSIYLISISSVNAGLR